MSSLPATVAIVEDGVTVAVFNVAGTNKPISAAGDINGDGIADLIIGRLAAPFNGSASGSAYVVFGRTSGWSSVDPNVLDGSNGVRIDGANVGDRAGQSVALLGDINGDGIDDILIGAPQSDATDSRGDVFVVFGKASGWDATLNLGALNGTDGFRIHNDHGSGGPLFALDVAGIGDINGDGMHDFALSSRFDSTGGTYSGSTLVFFGQSGGWSPLAQATSLTGANGFRIIGQAGDELGHIAAAGDINGDGFDDILVTGDYSDANGADSGVAYLVFGKASGWTASLSAGALGADGIVMTGLAAGHQLSGAVGIGDINNDGTEDFAVSARAANGYTGSAYIVFGRTGPWSTVDLASLDGVSGFTINGLAALHELGAGLSGGGDINGDGIDDLIVGAPGVNGYAGAEGATYVIYGRSSFSASFDVSTLNGSNGFKILGLPFLNGGLGAVVASGDVNGDGLADILLTADNQSQVVVVFGRQSDLTRVGTTADETLNGASADDTLSGMVGRDILNGLAGNDILNGGDNGDTLNGGDGADLLNGDAGGDVLYGGLGADTLNGGAEGDKLYGEDGADVLNGGAGNDTLFGGAGIDSLSGGDGNDVLDGGGQADVLVGGADNDIYIVSAAGATITELAGSGYDIIRASISLTLAAEVEALQLQGSADLNGTGNALANNLQGNSGANTLSGGAGVDTINGNDGNDRVIGGEGNDLLRGGLGADVFVVAHVFGPVLETDQIYDFSDAEGDSIDLSGAFTGTISEVAAFGRQAGEMTLTFSGGITTLRLDVNGDGKADYQMKINGDVTDHATAWML